MMNSLWGEEFNINSSKEINKKSIDKVNTPKKSVVSVEKVIRSKTISISEKLELIYS